MLLLSFGIFLNSDINVSLYLKALSKCVVGKNCFPSLLISTIRFYLPKRRYPEIGVCEFQKDFQFP